MDKKKMKIVKYDINEENLLDGVYCMSIVNQPAIMVDFVALSKHQRQQVKFKAVEMGNEQRMLYGPVLIPDQLIYRFDPETKDEWYAEYTADVIKKAAHKWLRMNMHQNANLEHNEFSQTDGIDFVESWIQMGEMDKSAELGFTTPAGTWYIGAHVKSDEIWDEVKNGTFNGFSLEGWFKPMEESTMPMEDVEDILNDMIKELGIDG
jgi:hypothetical protein